MTFGSDKPGLSDSEGDPTSATTRDPHQSVKLLIIPLQNIVAEADHLMATPVIYYVLLSTNNLVESLEVTIHNISETGGAIASGNKATFKKNQVQNEIYFFAIL